jgi:hypothetical protein
MSSGDESSGRLSSVSRFALSRLGTRSLFKVYEQLRDARSVAPEGELAAFDGLLVASQYRPYGLPSCARGSRVMTGDAATDTSPFTWMPATVTAYSISALTLRAVPEALRQRYAYLQEVGGYRPPCLSGIPASTWPSGI